MPTSRRFNRDWQPAALHEFLKEHRSNALLNERAVYLVDAERIAMLDEFIMGKLWSAVVRCTAPSPWTTWVGPDGERPHEAIKTLPGRPYMTRSLLFLIEDPNRPRRPGQENPAWYCRGKLEADTEQGFMLSFDFILSVPETLPFDKALRVLKEPLLRGCPPELSYSEGCGDSVGTLNVSFTGGKGVSGLMALSSDEPHEIVLDLTSKNVAAINAVHRLEQDFGGEAQFEEAVTALVCAYEAW